MWVRVGQVVGHTIGQAQNTGHELEGEEER